MHTLELTQPHSTNKQINDHPSKSLSLQHDTQQQYQNLLSNKTLLIKQTQNIHTNNHTLQQLLPKTQFLFLLTQNNLMAHFEHPL